MATDARSESGSTDQLAVRPSEAVRPSGPASPAAAQAGPDQPPLVAPADGTPLEPRPGLLQRSPVARHLLILVCYLAAGIIATWPRGAYLLSGKVQATRDAGVYVWDFWWMAHQILHLGNPWFTRAIAAPVGSQLGYHALMPLDGVVMLPVTLLFGPGASYNLLSILMPGLMGYAMYRAARLWLPGQLAPLAAGAFYGLSAEMSWHAWYQLNLAAGVLFLPVALEAAIRLRRTPRWPQAIFLGAAIGCGLLSDQESAVLVAILAAVVLAPWLLGSRGWDGLAPAGSPDASLTPVTGSPAPAQPLHTKLAAIGMTVVAAVVVGSPQILAMMAQTRSGGAYIPPSLVNFYYARSAAYLPSMFLGSPRLAGMSSALQPIASSGPTGDGVPTFGLIVTVLAVLGLVAFWRRRTAWLFAAIWLGSAALALGTTLRIGNHVYLPVGQTWEGVRVSDIMPFTWFVRLPGLAGFRESARILMLGFPAAAMLAGAGVSWLQKHSRVLAVVALAAAALELGWQGSSGTGTMPTTLPALDRPIAADHSSSIVVDVPFGIRGGVPLPNEGAGFDPEVQVLATADGHPRAIGYLSRIPPQVLRDITRHPFYAGLLELQRDYLPLQAALAQRDLTGPRVRKATALLAAAAVDARHMGLGWVLIWHPLPGIDRYLARTGFRFDYRADGVSVYRPASTAAQ
jgi:hypothetical protein